MSYTHLELKREGLANEWAHHTVTSGVYGNLKPQEKIVYWVEKSLSIGQRRLERWLYSHVHIPGYYSLIFICQMLLLVAVVTTAALYHPILIMYKSHKIKRTEINKSGKQFITEKKFEPQN